ncbi:aminotransferase class IV [Anaeromyxobacter oryzae]|uniref:branched-chain-amino-acid transaminase n=1 Tax=Anaeromyxobacter oryzae TaxID=2918170 RepID=A0ABN6N1V5_9BACT|nr:aminotransferase class IV [Anaeromyxobacter oryzae]BDG06003.1 branched chain amino acid aminotransferase [Anaeromyxobacter oryzae]
MATLVNVDGAIVPPAEARVSVFDRGFLYGDSVYEVIRTYGGAPFELDHHLARLAHSAERIGLALPWDADRTARELGRTLDAARAAGGDPPSDPGAAPWNVGEWYARVVMTRGAGEIGLDPALAVDPTAVVIVQPLQGPPARAYADGVKVVVVGVRHEAPAVVDPSAKTGAHLNHVLAVREARARGAHEALLLDDRGFVTEGSSSNVFAVLGGRLRTPPLAAGILEGVTRGVVLRIARAEGVAVDETSVRPEDLERAEEVFITSTMREIVPVTRLGERAVGAGRPGPVTERLHRAFRRLAGGAVGVGVRR